MDVGVIVKNNRAFPSVSHIHTPFVQEVSELLEESTIKHHNRSSLNNTILRDNNESPTFPKNNYQTK